MREPAFNGMRDDATCKSRPDRRAPRAGNALGHAEGARRGPGGAGEEGGKVSGEHMAPRAQTGARRSGAGWGKNDRPTQ
eukprot:5857792-Pyramimonas_sp.AAC.1